MYAVGCTQAARDKEGGGDIDPETKRDFPEKKKKYHFSPKRKIWKFGGGEMKKGKI